MTLELGVRHSWLERFPRRRLREPSRRGRVCPRKCHTCFADLTPLHASARRSTWRQSLFERRRIWHDEELSLDQIPSVGPYPSLLVLKLCDVSPIDCEARPCNESGLIGCKIRDTNRNLRHIRHSRQWNQTLHRFSVSRTHYTRRRTPLTIIDRNRPQTQIAR